MTEPRYDIVPPVRPLLRADGAPLDPRVRAEERRAAKLPRQLAWDAECDPAIMLREIVTEMQEADPAVLMPSAKFIEIATARYKREGQRVDPNVWALTMRSSFRHLLHGRVETAVEWLRHAYTGAGLATPDDARREMCDIIREFYPCAPVTYVPNAELWPPSLMQRALEFTKTKRRTPRNEGGE